VLISQDESALFTDYSVAVERWIRPRQVVAFHVGTADADRAIRDVRSAMPNAVTFARSLEMRRW